VKGIQPVKYWMFVVVGGDDLSGAAHLIALVVTTTSIILGSNKIQDGDISATS